MGAIRVRSYGQILALSIGLASAACASHESASASSGRVSALDDRSECAAGEHEPTLAALVEGLDDAYQAAGQDNNYVASERYENGSADYAALKQGHLVRDIASPFEFVEAVRTCILHTEGAYGPHLETDNAWKLAVEWAERLWTHESFVSAQRVGGPRLLDFEIVSAPCAIAVRDGADHTVVMQGMGVD